MWLQKGSIGTTKIIERKEEMKSNQSNDYNRAKLQWDNIMVLDVQCITALNQQIRRHLSFKQFGFGVLDPSVYQEFVARHLGTLQTVNGQYLNDKKLMDYSIDLVKQIRAHKMMHHQKSKMNQILRYHLNERLFDLRNGWDDTTEFTKQHVTEWIAVCNAKEVPPYQLLVEWLKQNRMFSKNKQITEYIRDTEHDDSFHWFCRVIAEGDESSFLHEDEKAKRAEYLEQIGFRKIQQLLKEKRINVAMYSEEDQKKMEHFLSGKIRFTPDILFEKGVMINGQRVHWIDMKNYFVTPKDGFMWKKMKQTCSKYTKAFGEGAILCKGFDGGARMPCNTLMLDAFAL